MVRSAYSWVYYASTALILASQIGVHGLEKDSLIYSCEKAEKPSVSFCSDVSWRSAQVFTGQSLEPQVPIISSTIDAYAKQHHAKLAVMTNDPACVDQIRRFTCADYFPHCPYVGAGAGYQLVCRVECDRVNELCGDSVNVNCSAFPSTNCFLFPRKTSFLLPVNRGPYGMLPLLYVCLLFAWCVLVTWWAYHAFVRHGKYSLLLTRVLTSVPICKLVVVSVCLIFWLTCLKWQYCSFWLGVACITCQVVFEASVYFSMLVIGKGWGITVDGFDKREWRDIVLIISLFYLFTTGLLTLRRTGMDQEQYWLLTSVAYSLIYLLIAYETCRNLYILRLQVFLAEGGASPAILSAIRAKYYMLTSFLLFVGLYGIVEVVSNTLQVHYPSLWVSLVFRELLEVIVFTSIGYVFRPAEYNIFFYMVPLTTPGGRRVPPFFTVEQQPSSVPVDKLSLKASKKPKQERRAVVVVQHPDGECSIGAAHCMLRAPVTLRPLWGFRSRRNNKTMAEDRLSLSSSSTTDSPEAHTTSALLRRTPPEFQEATPRDNAEGPPDLEFTPDQSPSLAPDEDEAQGLLLLSHPRGTADGIATPIVS